MSHMPTIRELLKVKHTLYSLQVLISGGRFDPPEEKDIAIKTISDAIKILDGIQDENIGRMLNS